MLDPITLDQLRAFVAVVDEGSFSAAARKLGRVQSAISTAMANLEAQLEVGLFDRATRIPSLTDGGQAVLASARRVLHEVDDLRRVSAGLGSGLEASVSLCIDALFPLDALVALCAAFEKRFPAVDLRIDTQLMSAVSARVRDGSATLGVVSPGGIVPDLERRALGTIRMVPVVAPTHPLARVRGVVRARELADAVQIVLLERSDGPSEDRAVVSARSWRVADLHTKHVLLRAGLGWGNLPENVAADDLRKRRLVRLRPEMWADDEHLLSLSAVYRSDAAFGPAHEWILGELPGLCSAVTSEGATSRAGDRPTTPRRERRSPRRPSRKTRG